MGTSGLAQGARMGAERQGGVCKGVPRTRLRGQVQGKDGAVWATLPGPKTTGP